MANVTFTIKVEKSIYFWLLQICRYLPISIIKFILGLFSDKTLFYIINNNKRKPFVTVGQVLNKLK